MTNLPYGYVSPFITFAADPTQYSSPSLMTATETLLQTKINGYWSSLNWSGSWPASQYATIIAMGWVPYVTITTFNYTNSTYSNSSLQAILAGQFDSQIDAYALATKNIPILVRPFHEMNIGGSGAGSWSLQPTYYGPCWQYIHGRWRAQGNLAPFLWAPNITWFSGAQAFGPYYPGDAYVDYVGLDGYRNFNRVNDSFQTQFQTDVNTMCALTSKPIMIAETGAANNDQTWGSRPGWISAMFDWLITQPNIVGLNWWQRDQYTLGGDALSVAAFASGVARWRAAKTTFIPDVSAPKLVTIGGKLRTFNGTPISIGAS